MCACAGGEGHGERKRIDTLTLLPPSSCPSLFNKYRDVKPPRLVEHIAVLAALRGVPFFVLPKATAALGQALGLQRVAALGFRTKEGATAAAQRGGAGGGKKGEEVVAGVQARLQSFQAFLLAKREYVNDDGGGGAGGGEGEEGGAVKMMM